LTHDSGRTWRQQTPPLPPGVATQTPVTTEAPVFFSSTYGVLPVTTFEPQGTLTDFYVTYDGGQTWTPTHAVPSSQASVWSFTDASHWWATSGNAIFVSNDAGQSWTTITPKGAFTNSISAFDMVTSRIGYAIVMDGNSGTGSLIKTTDGGHSWAKVAAVVGG
jgi:hypothetical protein